MAATDIVAIWIGHTWAWWYGWSRSDGPHKGM